MKLTQLEYFCVAARYHNITRASKELFVTQPSVSNAIKALEEEFGVNLFYRNNNKPDMYLSLKEEFPDVDFRLYEYGSIKACELVLEEKLDLAIVNAEQSAIDKCNLHIIDNEDLLFCVSKDHPLAEQSTLLLNMLTDESLVLFNTDSVQVMTLTRQFKAAGVNPHIVLNTSQITTLINMVKTNHIGCFLYKSMVDMYPELVGIPVFPAIEQRIGVIWRKGKYQNAVTEKVIRYLKNY